MKLNSVCFTGHRNIPVTIQEKLRLLLEQQIEALIYQGYQRFITGGALGFDTMAAIMVLRLRQTHSQIDCTWLSLAVGRQEAGGRRMYVYIK